MKTVVAIDPKRANETFKKNKKLAIAVYVITAFFGIMVAIIIISIAIRATQPTAYEKCVVITATDLYVDGASHQELFEKAEAGCNGSQKLYKKSSDFANHYNSQWQERSGQQVGGMTLDQWLEEYNK